MKINLVEKVIAIAVLSVGVSSSAFADCSAIFEGGPLRFMYNEWNQQVYGAVSKCGENSCFDGLIDFGNQGKQRIKITYDGSTWWADWFDTSNKSLWLMGTCQRNIARGKGGYQNRASDIYHVTIK